MWFECVYDNDDDRDFEIADFERHFKRERQDDQLDFEDYTFENKQVMNKVTYVNVLLNVGKNGCVFFVLNLTHI